MPTFLLGRNARGHWVVAETHGLAGGVFLERNQALHFALYECGRRSAAVIETAAPLELNALR